MTETKTMNLPIRKLGNVFVASLPFYTLFIIVLLCFLSIYYLQNPFMNLFLWWGLIPYLESIWEEDRWNYSKEDLDKLKKYNILFLLPLYFLIVLDLMYQFHVYSECVNPDRSLFYKLVLIIGYSETSIYLLEIPHNLVHYNETHNRFLSYFFFSKIFCTHFMYMHRNDHHRNNGLVEDSFYAKKGTTVWDIMFPTIIKEYIGAWEVSNQNSEKKVIVVNDFILIHILYLFLFYGYVKYFGFAITPYLFCPLVFITFFNITVNYFSHYGLVREKKKDGEYEPQSIRLSWNSFASFSKYLIFNAHRHSDHHLYPSKPYQCLQLYEESKIIPTRDLVLFTDLMLYPKEYCKTMDNIIEIFEDPKRLKELNYELDFYDMKKITTKLVLYLAVYNLFFIAKRYLNIV